MGVAGRGLAHNARGLPSGGFLGSAYPTMWEAPVSGHRTSVGLDVHARSVVAAALDGATGQVWQARFGGPHEVDPLLAWLGELPGPVATVYESGPTGFGLYRALMAAGVTASVAASSKLLRAPGDRVKTDRGDALLLARMLHLGEVTQVVVPSVAVEDARELVRAREDVRGVLQAGRQRLSKMLLRQGLLYPGATTWTLAHDLWLRQQWREFQRSGGPGLAAAFEDAYTGMMQAKQRRDALDVRIRQAALEGEFSDLVTRLCCLRGIDLITGLALVVEIGDWDRLTGARIGSYLGLVPSEYSSGASRAQGGITKTGNSHARRLLVEAAWHHKKPYRPGPALQARWAKAPGPVVARADQANRRLNGRWAAFEARKKKRTTAVVAVARELAGHAWALAVMD